MPVRCLRCGAPVEGLKQFCDDCAATQPRSMFNPVPPSAETAGAGAESAPQPAAGALRCPNCGTPLPAEAAFCPVCGQAVTGTGPSGMVYAGFWMRLLAYIVDGIILGVITLPIGFLVETALSGLVLQLVISAVYTLGFWMAKGATPGKMAMSLQIVMADGRPLTSVAAVVRYIGYFANILTLGIGYLMIAFTGRKRGLHDLIAGTVVVRKG